MAVTLADRDRVDPVAVPTELADEGASGEVPGSQGVVGAGGHGDRAAVKLDDRDGGDWSFVPGELVEGVAAREVPDSQVSGVKS